MYTTTSTAKASTRVENTLITRTSSPPSVETDGRRMSVNKRSEA